MLAQLVSDSAIDRMIADAQDFGIPLLGGPDGLIGPVDGPADRGALCAEMGEHVGYAKGDPVPGWFIRFRGSRGIPGRRWCARRGC
jgi:hypothetical protein